MKSSVESKELEIMAISGEYLVTEPRKWTTNCHEHMPLLQGPNY
jgi:hypothetical protein